MKFNAFDAGIEPGGLRNKSEIKILICYMLSSVGKPLTQQNINEIIQETGLANYFEVNDALAALAATQSIACVEEEGTPAYLATELTREVANTLETALPLSVREKAVHAAVRLLTKIRREQENRIEIRQNQDGYTIRCAILDGSMELMSIQVYVADLIQAESIKAQFLENPAAIYNGVINLLVE